MNVKRYRKKPVEVLAVQFDGENKVEIQKFVGKYLDQTVYVAAVYDCNGVIHSSGVLPYSIAAYCQKPPAGVQAH